MGPIAGTEVGPTREAHIVRLAALGQGQSRLVADVATLHARCLPESALTLMGEKGLDKAYRYISNSDSEKIFAAVSSNAALAGSAVLSVAPETFSRRLAFHLGLTPFVALAWSRIFWRSFLRGRPVPDGRTWVPERARGPEVLSMFVAPDQRRKGVGRRLLATCAETATNERFESLSVFAPGASQETLSFYRTLGFEDRGGAAVRGQQLRRLVLDLSHRSAGFSNQPI